MNLNNSTLTVFPVGAEVAVPPDVLQGIGIPQVFSGLNDCWEVHLGKFSTESHAELLCYDRYTSKVQVFAISGASLVPVGRATQWRANAQINVARDYRGLKTQVLVSDARNPDLELWEWQLGKFERKKQWPSAKTYRDLQGKRQTLWFSNLPNGSKFFSGNFIYSGEAEFLFTGPPAAILKLDPNEGFVQIGPDLSRVQLRPPHLYAGHFTSRESLQIIHQDSVSKEIQIYAIDRTNGFVPIGSKVGGSPGGPSHKIYSLFYTDGKPWTIYPLGPWPGEPTRLLVRGNGIAMLCCDSQGTLRLMGLRHTEKKPGMWPKSEHIRISYGKVGTGNAFLYYNPSLLNPTENKLADFDICTARTQEFINGEIAKSWEEWKQNIEIPYAFDSEGKPSYRGVKARMAPIQLEFTEADQQVSQLRVHITLSQGTVRYFDETEEEDKEYPFSEWRFSVLMDMDLVPVTREYLKQIDEGSAASVNAVIERSGLPDSAFKIECLFLKAVDTQGKVEGNVQTTLPSGVPPDAKNIMLSCFSRWCQGERGRFLLGTAARRSTEDGQSSATQPSIIDTELRPSRWENTIGRSIFVKPQPPALPAPTSKLAVTSVYFQVHPDKTQPGASNLAWLGVMEGRTLANLDRARGALADAWLRPPQSGPRSVLPSQMLGISRNIFMNRYLIPKFEAVFGASVFAETPHPTWTFRHNTRNSENKNDIIRRTFTEETTLTLRLAIEDHAIALHTEVVSQVNMDGYTHIGNGHSEWIHTRGRLQCTGSVEIETDYNKGYLAIRPVAKPGSFPTHPPRATVEQDDTKGGAKCLSAFESLFKQLGFIGSTTAERLGNRQSALINEKMKFVEAGLREINLELSQTAFIPPGGGIATFYNPHFSKYGDLLFDGK